MCHIITPAHDLNSVHDHTITRTRASLPRVMASGGGEHGVQDDSRGHGDVERVNTAATLAAVLSVAPSSHAWTALETESAHPHAVDSIRLRKAEQGSTPRTGVQLSSQSLLLYNTAVHICTMIRRDGSLLTEDSRT